MKKSIFTFLILVVLPTLVWAQYDLSGTISHSETGEPIVGANIVLNNGFKGAVSDKNGMFYIDGLRGGEYHLSVSFIGFQTYTQNLLISNTEKLTIDLIPKNVLTDEFIVSSLRVSDKTAMATTNVDKEELELLNLGQDFPYLLNYTPSVVTTSDAGAGIGYTGIRIRGTDATRINVTINGIPYNDAESQGTFWVDLPDFASSVNNVQIQRGVGSSTNGAAAFGGSINVQTATLQEKAYGEINTGYGSFNTWRNNVQFGSGLISNHFTIDGRLSKITSDGYIDRASADLTSLFLSGGFYHKNHILRANVFTGHEVTYQSWNGVPEGRVTGNEEEVERIISEFFLDGDAADNLRNGDRRYNEFTYDDQVDDYQQDHYQLLYAGSFNDFSLNLGFNYTKGFGFFEQFRAFDDIANYGLDNQLVVGEDTTVIDATDLIRRKWLDNDFYVGTYALGYTKNNVKLTLGGAYSRYIGDHFGEVIWAQFMGNGNIRHRFYDNEGDKSDFNIFLKGEHQLTSKLNLFGDVQFRRVTHHIKGLEEDLGVVDIKRDFNFFNPKVGVSYDLNDQHNVYTSFSIGNREPNRSNILFNNVTPTAETLRDLELGYRWNARKYAISANYYFMHYKDQLVPTGELDDVGAVVQVNVPQSYRTGIELVGTWKPLRNLSYTINATFSQNKIKEFSLPTFIYDNPFNYGFQGDTTIVYENTDIAFSPNIIAGSNLTYQPIKGLSLSLLSKFVGKQFLDNTANDKRSLAAYGTVDLKTSYSFSLGPIKEVEFSLLVNNLLNTQYSSNGYTWFVLFNESGTVQESNYNFLYPQAGINFLSGLKVRF